MGDEVLGEENEGVIESLVCTDEVERKERIELGKNQFSRRLKQFH